MPRPSIAFAEALCALAPAGCGGEGGATSTSATVEAAQPAAKLPAHWHRHLDRRGGFTIGVPTGWKAHQPRSGLLISSPDRLVAISVAADRTAAAHALPLERFGRSVLAALPGYRRPLDPGPPRPFAETPLDGVRVGAIGGAAGGVTERVTLIALRRDRLASFTLAAANRHAPPAEVGRALAIAGTLRDHPPAQSRGGRSGRSG